MFARKPYTSDNAWYEALRKEESKAILYLSRKIEAKIAMDCRQRGLVGWEDEVLNEILLRVIRHIRNGKYQYQEDTSPATYALSCAKYVILEFWKAKNSQITYDELMNQPDPLDDITNTRQVREEVEHWLALLEEKGGVACATLIRKLHLENYNYEEVLANKWVAGYTTERSLATKRSNCWNILIELIKNYRNTIQRTMLS